MKIIINIIIIIDFYCSIIRLIGNLFAIFFITSLFLILILIASHDLYDNDHFRIVISIFLVVELKFIKFCIFAECNSPIRNSKTLFCSKLTIFSYFYSSSALECTIYSNSIIIILIRLNIYCSCCLLRTHQTSVLLVYIYCIVYRGFEAYSLRESWEISSLPDFFHREYVFVQLDENYWLYGSKLVCIANGSFFFSIGFQWLMNHPYIRIYVDEFLFAYLLLHRQKIIGQILCRLS